MEQAVIFRKRPDVSEVFTPRAQAPNSKTYIARPDLEKRLSRSIKGSLHTLIHGESGSGKTWLYKKVLRDVDAHVSIVNCANASLKGSILKEIDDAIFPNGKKKLTGYTEKTSAEVGAVVAKGTIDHNNSFQFSDGDTLQTAYAQLKKDSGSRNPILVFDNLEAIYSDKNLMRELANIILLLDDSRYAKFNIKFLLVGVPRDITTYFSKLENMSSVGNRIEEIPEVDCLSSIQVKELLHKGLVTELKIDIDTETEKKFSNHVFSVTLGIPQRVQEYCEKLAYSIQDSNWVASPSHLEDSDKQWLESGLKQAYQTIEGLMNEKETKAGRRNQTLYTLTKITKNSFTVSEVEDLLRQEFPTSTEGIKLAIGQILSELATQENTVIKRTAKGNGFQFTDARYLMCMRLMLRKNNFTEKISKIEI
ncbi:ATP-binding protein [Pseudomonas oryzihabitans]|uniref:ATP-binding protein n=1 Tax=Pseudomonas oryzihabitans TaxID=47885 RepID=UPI001F523D0C|nr:ATP-binding protein [Pseudomonas oryzihabitans]MCI1009913.1 ATP-binding protein [Pseudomonas oryzihabitans]